MSFRVPSPLPLLRDSSCRRDEHRCVWQQSHAMSVLQLDRRADKVSQRSSDPAFAPQPPLQPEMRLLSIEAAVPSREDATSQSTRARHSLSLHSNLEHASMNDAFGRSSWRPLRMEGGGTISAANRSCSHTDRYRQQSRRQHSSRVAQRKRCMQNAAQAASSLMRCCAASSLAAAASLRLTSPLLLLASPLRIRCCHL